MVADGDFGTKACRLPDAGGRLGVGAVPSPEVNVRELVVRVGTIGCFGGGAAVGTLVPVPHAGTPDATEWILRALEAFGTFVVLLFLLTVVDRGVIQGKSPHAFSTRSLAWADPIAGARTIGVVDVTRLESDLRQEIRDLNRIVAELAGAVKRIERRMDVVERRRWWRR
jgi:hypothetical protein